MNLREVPGSGEAPVAKLALRLKRDRRVSARQVKDRRAPDALDSQQRVAMSHRDTPNAPDERLGRLYGTVVRLRRPSRGDHEASLKDVDT
ncbi:MAG: hypothetical protein ACTHZD_16165 [Micrococcaceae bacterium]